MPRVCVKKIHISFVCAYVDQTVLSKTKHTQYLFIAFHTNLDDKTVPAHPQLFTYIFSSRFRRMVCTSYFYAQASYFIKVASLYIKVYTCQFLQLLHQYPPVFTAPNQPQTRCRISFLLFILI